MIIKLNNILDLFFKNLLKKKDKSYLYYLSLILFILFISRLFIFLSLFLSLSYIYNLLFFLFLFLSFSFSSTFISHLYFPAFLNDPSLHIHYIYTISPFHHACIILHVAKKIVIISFVYKLIHIFYKNRIFRPTF